MAGSIMSNDHGEHAANANMSGQTWMRSNSQTRKYHCACELAMLNDPSIWARHLDQSPRQRPEKS
jgi:hypothetical protein